MNCQQLLFSGINILKQSGDTESENDARQLFFFLTGMDLTSYTKNILEPADEALQKKFLSFVRRRAAHEPLQYITNTAYFRGLEFYVDRNVLIPRYDTEITVETALHFLKPGMQLLDLCTGSGCILLSMLKEGPGEISGTGSDISESAVAVAEKNAERLGISATFVQSDLFEKIGGTYDIITANPPYIRSGERDSLMPEVRSYEPETALFGGEDGLCYYRSILRGVPGFLKKGGTLIFEIGADEAEDVASMMETAGFIHVLVRRDLAGRDRTVSGGWHV